MNVIVLVKEVPDMNKVKFDCETGTVNRASAEAQINPFDLNAIQTAVDLKNNTPCNVTAVTMGPSKAIKSLRDAYARGADRLVLISDRKFGGSDTLATSRTISAAIRSKMKYDLIICGEKSVDGDTAQIGAEVAELLGIPHCYYVDKIVALRSESVDVEIEDICGNKQERTIRLPAVLSVTKNINHPDLPGLERKIDSLEVNAELVTFAELEDSLAENETGFAGSPTKVARIEVPGDTTREGQIVRGEYKEFAYMMKDVIRKAI